MVMIISIVFILLGLRALAHGNKKEAMIIFALWIISIVMLGGLDEIPKISQEISQKMENNSNNKITNDSNTTIVNTNNYNDGILSSIESMITIAIKLLIFAILIVVIFVYVRMRYLKHIRGNTTEIQKYNGGGK